MLLVEFIRLEKKHPKSSIIITYKKFCTRSAFLNRHRINRGYSHSGTFQITNVAFNCRIEKPRTATFYSASIRVTLRLASKPSHNPIAALNCSIWSQSICTNSNVFLWWICAIVLFLYSNLMPSVEGDWLSVAIAANWGQPNHQPL